MIKNYIEIDGRNIGSDYEPYIIAELSANYNSDINRAFELLEMVKECSADAIKLQTYTQNTLTIDCDKPDFKINGGLWGGLTSTNIRTIRPSYGVAPKCLIDIIGKMFSKNIDRGTPITKDMP